MNDKELASMIQGDINLILKGLDDFKKEEDGNLAKLREESIIDPVRLFRHSLESLHGNVEEFVKYPDSKKALKAITLLSFITAQPDAVGARLSIIASQVGIMPYTQQAAFSISTTWNSFKQKIQSVIQSISSALWSLISSYLNLKEWSVKGTVSTPAITSLFGISGSVEIQFTFEK